MGRENVLKKIMCFLEGSKTQKLLKFSYGASFTNKGEKTNTPKARTFHFLALRGLQGENHVES
jgi:hypothetical protein